MAEPALDWDVLATDAFRITDIFLGQVAHDFGNLLMPLLTYPQLLRMDLEENSAGNELLDGIEQASGDIEHITRQIASLSTRNLDPMQPLNLSDMVTQAIRQNAARISEAACTIETVPDSFALQINGYADQVQAAIGNLLTNAVDAGPGKTIKVEAGLYENDKEFPLASGGTLPAGCWHTLKVIDEGCGMDEAIAQQVLKPFFTTKRGNHPRGAGLGLCIVFRTQHLHGGHVDFQSSPGNGSCFTLYYPGRSCS